MKSPAALQAMKDFLLRLPESVRMQLRTVTPKEVGQQYLLHISRDNKLKSFSPRVSNFLAPTEDRSVPRICTATTVFGCFHAYQRELRDFMERSVDENSKFLGGWVIYGLPFDIALQPTKKLLGDVEVTNEHWLVAYSQQTTDYPVVPLGKVFFSSVMQVGTLERAEQHVTMVFEVTHEDGLYYDAKTKLGQGYWSLTTHHNAERRSWKDCRGRVRLTQISQAEYREAKKLTADLLSHRETPASARW